MSSSIEVKREVRKRLLAVPHAKAVNDGEVVMFCPFCNQDTDHGHFYVSTKLNSDEPLYFHCFKCEISGVVTPELLHMFEIHDLQLSSRIKAFNKTSKRQNPNEKNRISNSIFLKIPKGSTDRDLAKKRYFENRMGVEFTFEEMQELKAVFDIGKFFKENDIRKYSTNIDTLRVLNRDYLGFITAKNEFINFRDATNTHGKKNRYFKYNIFNALDNTKKFYSIPNEIDLLTTEDINIIMTEGIFDILSVYSNIYKKNKKNCIFVAMCSSGYANVLSYYIQEGFIGNNIHVHIYSDSDRRIPFYKKTLFKSKLQDWVSSFTIHYNTFEGEKDFGVPLDRISIKSIKIK